MLFRLAFVTAILLCFFSAILSASDVPNLNLQDLKGTHHNLSEYKGKVVLLNFWATWCVPCASEMPLLGEMQRHYKGKLVVIAASIDDPLDRNKLEPFLRKHKAGNLKLMVGPTLDTLSDIGMGDALPDTLFIDAQGNIAAKSAGALKRADVEKRLAEMTRKPQSSAKASIRSRAAASAKPD
ncbi:MAG TPA: TlpA disulfide reductase family protein [Terriglobales bacterium]|nr:TlpA disulfide reductase family protein [Terriglobales bacterium]